MPNPLRDFSKGWLAGFKRVGTSFATAFNALFLSIAYFLGVGITAIAAKIVRKRFLDTTWSPQRATHWVDHVQKTEPIDKYKRQF